MTGTGEKTRWVSHLGAEDVWVGLEEAVNPYPRIAKVVPYGAEERLLETNVAVWDCPLDKLLVIGYPRPERGEVHLVPAEVYWVMRSQGYNMTDIVYPTDGYYDAYGEYHVTEMCGSITVGSDKDKEKEGV